MKTGTVLAHYKVGEIIGKGGMGEVYRAHDGKLGRDVALKILPREFAADSDRMARFEREAKVLASLHHPNIASIFGFESTPECTFLVMELVEGQDLSEILRTGPMPVDEAVEIAQQIAEGLEEAHEKGIVHRDLKPANVKRTPDGKVKVLDFGLARAFTGQTAGEGEVSSAPTMTAAMTQVGTVMGTAAYMSPEQARGKEVDRRADIWSFGVILFEMLTGKQVFMGETASDTLAGILKSDPDWDSLPEGLPFQVERVLRRCLAKDPRQRLRDIGEARVRLENPEAESGMFSGSVQAVQDSRGALNRLLPWGLFAAALAAVVVLGLSRTGDPGTAASNIPYRFELRTPAEGGLPEISPDGRRFAYVADLDGGSVVWIRSFAEPEGRPLKGTEPRGGSVVWSPDGGSVAYFTEESLEQVSIEGGTPRVVCTVPSGWRSADWAADGSFLIEINVNPEHQGWYLWRPGDREIQRLERPLPLEDGQTRARPTFLPDGKHFVFTQNISGVRNAVLGEIGTGKAHVLFPTDTQVRVARDGWYIFSRKGQLLAQAFDPETFTVVGEGKLLAEKVALFVPNGRLSASVSNQGSVIYQTYEEDRQIAWFDRQGKELGPVVEIGDFRDSRLSPDGRYLALVVNDHRSGTGDLWVRDLERGISNPLTDTVFSEFSPVWSPDGRQIAFSADPNGPPDLFAIGVDGGPARELCPSDKEVNYPSDWTGQGQRILFTRSWAGAENDIWMVDAEGGDPEILVQTDHSEGGGRVSPDGRWLAYRSSSTGRSEIFLRPFVGGGANQRVSIDGGWDPRWDGNGRLFFKAPGEKLMAVDLEVAGDRPDIGIPEEILVMDKTDMREYSLHPDGRIMVTYDTGPMGVAVSKVIVGWDQP